MSVRVLVCGGRDYVDWNTVSETLDEVRPTLVIHGGATGADALAASWASFLSVDTLAFPVSKAEWRTIGKRAGPLRNARMLAEGKPDLVVAFPGGRGTADMVAQAKAAGVEVREVAP